MSERLFIIAFGLVKTLSDAALGVSGADGYVDPNLGDRNRVLVVLLHWVNLNHHGAVDQVGLPNDFFPIVF
jgi:hypothetical protein